MRAQSETIGFVLVFALVVTTIATLYVVGIPALEDARDAERIDNMERAFEVLDANFDDIVRQSAPSRGTEIKLSGGSLSVGGGTAITVFAVNTTDSGDNATFTATTRPINYTDDGTDIALSFGAVFRDDGDEPVMRSGPGWRVSENDTHAGENRTVIPLPVVVPEDNTSTVGGSTTVLVTGTVTSSELERFTTGSGSTARVNVTVTSDRVGAWDRYLAGIDGAGKIDSGPGFVTYQLRTDELYVPRHTVEVAFE